MYFNPNPNLRNTYYFRNQEFPRSIIYPRFNSPIRKQPIINLSKILDTTQRGINTINQIVPIYKQVTPIIKQMSNFTKSFSSFIFKRNNINTNNNQVNPSSKIQEDYRSTSNPSTPFFK